MCVGFTCVSICIYIYICYEHLVEDDLKKMFEGKQKAAKREILRFIVVLLR